jgi:transcriptional regulator GlxA family with amidase domain
MHPTGLGTANAAQTVVARLDAALPGWRDASLRIRDLARIAGVSPRTIHRTFADHYGAPPIAHLRRERLAGARRQLLDAGPGVTVTSVALDWGFVHFGRFAGSYARCFGERPSETLRRRREAHGERLDPAA